MLWPGHPKPLNDELLSSWLVRICAANFQKLHTFSRATWPELEIWTRDIDRSVPSEVLQTIADRTATSLIRVNETTLGEYTGRLFEAHSGKGNSTWLLPLGVYHRTHKRFGIQFCPQCLAEDVPYYRRSWRLAFVTVCERHDALLLDRCQHCGAALSFHRGERGDRNSRDASGAMTSCHACFGDLTEGRGTHSARDVIEVLVVQQRWSDALSRGFVQLPNGSVLYSHLFFAGLRILFQNFAAGETGGRLRRKLDCGRGDWAPTWGDKNHSIERLDVADRFELALRVARVTADWPKSFVALCNECDIVASDLIGPLRYVPFWYQQVVEEHFLRGTYSPTLPEISSAINYLRRRDVPVTSGRLSRLLGVSDVTRKRKLKWMLSDHSESLIEPSSTPDIGVATAGAKKRRAKTP
jgi:hypothetical protein